MRLPQNLHFNPTATRISIIPGSALRTQVLSKAKFTPRFCGPAGSPLNHSLRLTASPIQMSGMSSNAIATLATIPLDPARESIADFSTIKFSAGSDSEILTKELELLLQRWSLNAQNNGLERTFKFKTFKKTWEFMNAIAAQCALKKHHPEWSNVYNTTFIRWTTHSPPGLSEKDVSMAKFCDEQATTFGEIIDAYSTQSTVAQELADTVVIAGGECCVPKSKG